MSQNAALFPQEFTIVRIEKETPSASTFYLRPDRGPIHYKAGQYITFNNEGTDPSKSRSYSFSSAPHEKELSITIKRQENGYFSRLMIDKAQVGDKVRAIGVFGKFVLPEPTPEQAHYLFFAAGSGITPIYSLIKSILATQAHAAIHLYYSNSSREQTIFREQLNEMILAYPNRLKIHYFFSQENAIHDARISAFMIPDILKQIPHQQPLCYLCGPIDYMDTIGMSLKTYGIPAANIFTEEFFQYRDEEQEFEIQEPPDQKAHSVTIRLPQRIVHLRVQYPESILQTALNNDIHLPYSCGSGQCGACVAKLIRGKVWMTYNSVLTDDEIKSGMTLTCMGFPIEGDVEIGYE